MDPNELPPEMLEQFGIKKKKKKPDPIAIKIDKIGNEKLCHYDSAKRH